MSLIPPIVLFLFLEFFFHVSAQPPPSGQGYYRRGDLVTNFEPSLAVVTGVLSIMFTLTFILLVYAKCCHDEQSADGQGQNGQMINGSNSSRFSGIDKTVIESLPFFRFSSLKGSRQGLECSVCLSKFEDVEILRLLPKCKHAFHISCIDQWLEQHSTCPLCRNRVTTDDPSIFAYSNSLRFMNHSEISEDSNLELYIEREEEEEEEEGEDERRWSLRFSVGGSFRKILKKGNKEKGLLGRGEGENGYREKDVDRKVLHKLNHKIVFSDVVFKNRWSNVTSADLMFLNSEMISSMSSERFSSLEQKDSELSIVRKPENEGILRIKEEMEMKIMFENKVSSIKKASTNPIFFLGNQDSSENSRTIQPGRRSVSEITAIPRFNNVLAITKKRHDESCKNEAAASSSSVPSHQINIKEERRRRLWLPIARRTVQWFANREKRSQQSQINTTQQHLDV